MSNSTVVRVEPVDTLAVDEELLVLYERQLVRLAPVAAAVFEVAASPVELATLAGELDARFGAPEGVDLAAATADVVEQLVTLGVLEQLDPVSL